MDPVDADEAHHHSPSDRKRPQDRRDLRHLRIHSRVGFALGLDRRAALREHILEPVDVLPVGYGDDETPVDRRYSQGSGVLFAGATSFVVKNRGIEVTMPGEAHHGGVEECPVEAAQGVDEPSRPQAPSEDSKTLALSSLLQLRVGLDETHKVTLGVGEHRDAGAFRHV